MDIEIGIKEVLEALEALGLSVPGWLVLVLAVLVFAKWLGVLDWIIDLIVRGLKAVGRILYNRETWEFVRIRNRFVEHLIYEVERLNREADWNDFHYTALEAEVEVDPSLDLDMSRSNPILAWLRLFRSLPRSIFRMLPSGRVEKNLVRAIMRSKSRAFLVIGDPGSGKTVSLRHLFLRMAKQCAISRDRTATVPLYLNLKRLNVPPEDVTADRVHKWIVEELRAGQDRTIHEFIEVNFERMLEQSAFFFLFDSFDEIPAVMDAQEEEEVVRQYAEALNRFLHSPHGCRGLIASRRYRAPKIFVGQRMEIYPLSNARIKNALSKYMIQYSELAKQLWRELVQRRGDLLDVARNPFYLNLLARYAKERRQLPARQYDLFEHFVQTRARTDEERLFHFGLTPEELIEGASILAFAMTQTPHIGLEANKDQIRTVLRRFDRSNGWDSNRVKQLLDALCYSKLGRMSQGEPGSPNIFSFVHRRFHEYCCARYLRDHPEAAPVEDLIADNRWREILVLLCEVLPSE
jgi:predicted NACHT family NTPase